MHCRLGNGPPAAAPPSPALDHREQKHPHPEDEEDGGNVEGDWCPLWVLTLHSKKVVHDLSTSGLTVRCRGLETPVRQSAGPAGVPSGHIERQQGNHC
ncbi:hypothetical protein OAZ88_00315 [bacterium]|nr:hypothetical protein [bacterium]